MSIQDFITYLKGLGINAPIYPNSFPASSPNKCMIVEIGQSFSSRGSVSEITLTITVRDKHIGKAEALAQEVNKLLSDRTDVPLGESGQIILIKSQQLIPSYLGKDVGANHYYMNNFRVLVNS